MALHKTHCQVDSSLPQGRESKLTRTVEIVKDTYSRLSENAERPSLINTCDLSVAHWWHFADHPYSLWTLC